MHGFTPRWGLGLDIMRKIFQILDRKKQPLLLKREKRRLLSYRKRQLKTRGFQPDGKCHRIVVDMPSALTIQNKRGRRFLLNCIENLKKYVNNRPVLIDFSSTFIQYPTAVLLLTAELDRLKRAGKSRYNVSMIRPKNEVSFQVLLQVGLAELCGESSPEQNDHFDESVRHWRYATGERMNDAPGRAMERFEGHLSGELHEGIWKGVSEAIVNSVHHAYLEPRRDGFGGADEVRWWMFSHVRDGNLTVVVCDLGIGIPRSLPIVWGKSRVAQLLTKFGIVRPEVAAVRAALEIGATRTQQENRGRGLPQVWGDMKTHAGAHLLLLSNKAQLYWNADEKKESEREYDESIFGTMIMWTVPLSEENS